VTLAGTAVATIAAVLAVVGLTGGCSGSTDTTSHDQPRMVVQAPANPIPPRVIVPRVEE
jgi:hypothetical protein